MRASKHSTHLVGVWMVLLGELVVGLFNVLVARTLGHTQDVVKVLRGVLGCAGVYAVRTAVLQQAGQGLRVLLLAKPTRQGHCCAWLLMMAGPAPAAAGAGAAKAPDASSQLHQRRIRQPWLLAAGNCSCRNAAACSPAAAGAPCGGGGSQQPCQSPAYHLFSSLIHADVTLLQQT